MQSATTPDDIVGRLVLASGAKNELGLAAFLGISAQSIYNARKKNKIPPAWGVEIAKTFNVSSDWIFFGRGSMHPQNSPETTDSPPICSRCIKLENKLEKVENQRDDLAAENRRLWKENAALREENATLRERQRKEDQASLFDERKDFRRNDEPLQTRPLSRG